MSGPTNGAATCSEVAMVPLVVAPFNITCPEVVSTHCYESSQVISPGASLSDPLVVLLISMLGTTMSGAQTISECPACKDGLLEESNCSCITEQSAQTPLIARSFWIPRVVTWLWGHSVSPLIVLNVKILWGMVGWEPMSGAVSGATENHGFLTLFSSGSWEEGVASGPCPPPSSL